MAQHCILLETPDGPTCLLKCVLRGKIFLCHAQTLVKTPYVLSCITLTIKKVMIENRAVGISKG